MPNCATSSLEAYIPSQEKPWNNKRVQHLYRRMAFDADRTMLESALAMNPSELVDTIIDEALSSP